MGRYAKPDAWWALPDDEGLGDSERARMIGACVLADVADSAQGVVACVGRAAVREGKSFDESLNAYFILYAKPAWSAREEKLLRRRRTKGRQEKRKDRRAATSRAAGAKP